MITRITYTVRHCYGRTLRDVQDAQTRDLLRDLTGRDTLTKRDVDILRALGFTVEPIPTHPDPECAQ